METRGEHRALGRGPGCPCGEQGLLSTAGAEQMAQLHTKVGSASEGEPCQVREGNQGSLVPSRETEVTGGREGRFPSTAWCPPELEKEQEHTEFSAHSLPAHSPELSLRQLLMSTGCAGPWLTP